MLLEALVAVNGPIIARNKRDLGRCTTVCANRIIKLAVSVSCILPVGSAGLAANGLILETLFGIKLLLASGEDEFLAAVLAHQCLVFEHLCFPLFGS